MNKQLISREVELFLIAELIDQLIPLSIGGVVSAAKGEDVITLRTNLRVASYIFITSRTDVLHSQYRHRELSIKDLKRAQMRSVSLPRNELAETISNVT